MRLPPGMNRRLTAVLALTSLMFSTAGLALAQEAREEPAPEEREEPAERRAPSKLRRAGAVNRVEVSFEDAQLPELVRYVARVTGRRFILSGSMRDVRVTIVSERPVTPRELYDGFLAVLQMHGMTVVRAGRYHRIVETEGIEGRNTPVVTDGQAARRSGDAYMLRMHRVRDGSVEEAAELLRHFSSPGGSITAHLPTQTLLISDTAANIQRMLTILDNARAPEPERRIYVERLRHASPEEMTALLEQLPGNEGRPD